MSTTVGIKVDDLLRERIRNAAQNLNRTPHWLIKQAVVQYVDALERGATTIRVLGAEEGTPEDGKDEVQPAAQQEAQPFLAFAQSILPQTPLRAAITAAWHRPETECLPALLPLARTQDEEQAAKVHELASRLVQGLRDAPVTSGVAALLQEFALSSQEGVALMCLAEALLRIPDKATRDALIRDKISRGDWDRTWARAPRCSSTPPPGACCSPASWSATHSEGPVGRAAPPRRQGRRAADPQGRGHGHAHDGRAVRHRRDHCRGAGQRPHARPRASAIQLRHAGRGRADQRRRRSATCASYEQAIHAIGKAAAGRGIYEGPGISIKLSALHPRYSRAQYDRVMDELYPRVLRLAELAAVRHRPEHRRRGGRPAGAVARPAGAPVPRPHAGRLERHRLRHPGLPEALPAVIDF
jgi:RHH-type proline utilization regulon transcriptional repressor/proline dehydrogenase/delta 1-pyrroline-5-carboxylate dehydrogenase